jgi:anti-sigma B factor antagonist
VARSVARPLEHVAQRASLRLHVRRKMDATAPVLELLGEFDIDSVPEIDRFLRRHLGPLYHRQHLVMDLREVTFIDSSFIGFLVRLVRDQRATQRELLLTSPVGQVRRALALVGLPNVVPVFDSVEEAVATLATGRLPVIPPAFSAVLH